MPPASSFLISGVTPAARLLHLGALARRLRTWAFVTLAIAASVVTAAEPADLLAGSKWEFSTDEGATFSATPPTITGGMKAPVVSRTEFEVKDISKYASLELFNDLIPSLPKSFAINGREIQPLLPVMYYNRYPVLDPSLLKPGRNTLTARVVIDARRRAVTYRATVRLVPKTASALAIEVGPVLGAFGPDWFSVTCTTNMKVPVHVTRIERDGRETIVATSSAGVYHRFRLARATADSRRHALITGPGAVRREFLAPEFPNVAAGKLRFIATGDPQSEVAQWSKMSAAIARAKPDFVVFAGDLVGSGRDDDAWAPEFFDPARELLASVPSYTVHGNHEGQAPVVEEYFYGPGGPDGRARNWVQAFGDVTLVGIDQWIHLDWSAGSENARWFEDALAAAKTKFVFVITHYPAYSSCSHGKVDEQGTPLEIEIRRAREVLVPLMLKHRATAMICGHDHYYERTEIPGGLVQIITGGAGRATDGQSKAALRQNPYSKTHAALNHYSVVELADGRCTLRAFKADGTVLDTVEFKPRTP